MIGLISSELVPVWIDVRRSPVPDLEAVRATLIGAELDHEHRVCDLFSLGFFLRSLVLSPDGRTLLNPQPNTVEGSVELFRRRGYFSYAQVRADDYLEMLSLALERHRARALQRTRDRRRRTARPR